MCAHFNLLINVAIKVWEEFKHFIFNYDLEAGSHLRLSTCSMTLNEKQKHLPFAMNSNNLKLFPIISLKPKLWVLCPGIYNINNSLEPRTLAVSADREGGVHNSVASNKPSTWAQSSQPNSPTTLVGVGGFSPVLGHTPSWHLSSNSISTSRCYFPTSLTHKKSMNDKSTS